MWHERSSIYAGKVDYNLMLWELKDLYQRAKQLKLFLMAHLLVSISTLVLISLVLPMLVYNQTYERWTKPNPMIRNSSDYNLDEIHDDDSWQKFIHTNIRGKDLISSAHDRGIWHNPFAGDNNHWMLNPKYVINVGNCLSRALFNIDTNENGSCYNRDTHVRLSLCNAVQAGAASADEGEKILDLRLFRLHSRTGCMLPVSRGLSLTGQQFLSLMEMAPWINSWLQANGSVELRNVLETTEHVFETDMINVTETDSINDENRTATVVIDTITPPELANKTRTVEQFMYELYMLWNINQNYFPYKLPDHLFSEEEDLQEKITMPTDIYQFDEASVPAV